MKERPIMFSGDMVRAILDGRKTQSRRVINPQPVLTDGWWDYKHRTMGSGRNAIGGGFCNDETMMRTRMAVGCKYGRPGDRLWVRETWKTTTSLNVSPGIRYRSDGAAKWFTGSSIALEYGAPWNESGPWKPSIFMPRWASRITLEITAVRVERVQDISEEDAKAEGAEKYGAQLAVTGRGILRDSYVAGYALLWNTINEKRKSCAWADNPWVWVLTFSVVKEAQK